jgi:DNA-binding NarL/FixJ family response regulator
MRVFLVEDSRILAPQLIEMIEAIPGVAVVGHAVDARTAIEAIARLRVQVAIVDISLRAGNGFDVVKSFVRLEHPPVSIFLTNYVSAPVRAAAARLGVDHFFDKARDIDRLIVTLTVLAARPDMRNGSDG